MTEASFWILLLGINFVMFLPAYLINIRQQANPFFFFKFQGDSLKDKIFAFYLRKSSDPFRVHSDYTIAVLIFLLLKCNDCPIWILGIIFTISVSSLLYGAIMAYVFRRKTVLKSDLSLLKAGLIIFKYWKYLLIFFFLLFFLGLYYVGIYFSKILLYFSIPSWQLLLALAFIISISFIKPKSLRYDPFFLTFFSGFLHLWNSNKRGKKYDYILDKSLEFFESKNVFNNLDLCTKPNIRVFCIESYGSICFKDKNIYNHLSPTIKHFNLIFKNKKLHTASTLSIPPIFSGGSWMSYTSFLFGFKIDDIELYNILFKYNKNFNYYQSLFRWLKSKGYAIFLINPLSGGYDRNIDWKSVQNCFSYDKFIGWKNIDYKGKTFKYLDVGYSPADQYSVNKSMEIINRSQRTPNALFFISLNSHIPFSSPINIEKNWKKLNNENYDYPTTGNAKKNLMSKYKKAINYQLGYIFDLINRETNHSKDDIYILFGDHQPPFITNEKLGLETPIHVLSTNKNLIKSLCKNGFYEGLNIDINKDFSIKHEAFFSIFMNALNYAYGKNPNLEVPIFSNGIQFE